jgi:hypothetical protein
MPPAGRAGRVGRLVLGGVFALWIAFACGAIAGELAATLSAGRLRQAVVGIPVGVVAFAWQALRGLAAARRRMHGTEE